MMFEQYMQEYMQEHADEIREEAWAEGMEAGMEAGMETATIRLNKLNEFLLSANRLSDLQRALHDPEYQKQLFCEFGL